MGAGKTSAPRRPGARDADEEIEARLGAPVDAIFARDGEAAFRKAEEEVVLELLGERAPAVALGGGAVLSERVREALADFEVVWLDVGADTAWARCAGSG